MPELPEVETIKKQLNKSVVGKTIQNIQVLRDKSFVGNPKLMLGKKIKKIKRQAKVLVIEFEKDFLKLLIHLKMTGQLIYLEFITSNLEPNKIQEKRIVGGHPTLDWIDKLPSKHTRVVITFSNQSKLFFNDMRVFGWLKLITNQKQLEKELAGVSGIEPLTKDFTVKNLQEIFQNKNRAIKQVLLEQKLIAGIGNIYANDALYKSKINPQKQAKKLTKKEISNLKKAIEEVIALGIKYGGASDSDYVQLDGLAGSYQEHFLVYKKEGQNCPHGHGKIVKVKLGGRGTYYCPVCQK